VAAARADFVPPSLGTVSVQIESGTAVVQWDTDEPADALVRYSLDSSLSLAVTNARPATNHAVVLNDLVAGRRYYFIAVSSDDAGNTATNDNQGQRFSFVARDRRSCSWSTPTCLISSAM